ncbi:hypothetical protein MPSEU_000222400 [Mayamaea pseudoterrestris]|nr:hypothetical protein MPSEU_000222400 [Mayamaea pseudoterrestris]
MRYSGCESSATYYKACASVGIHGKLTTTAKPHEPWILRVCYESKVLELNLGHTFRYEITAAVQGYLVSNGQDDDLILLLLVDHNGVILKLYLHQDLTPARGSCLIDTPQRYDEMIAAKQKSSERFGVTQGSLMTSQVAFLNASKLVLAMGKFILCVALDSNQASASILFPWTREALTRKNRRFSMFNVISDAVGAAALLSDLQPCLSMATAFCSNGDVMLASLHNDGLLNLWTLPSDISSSNPTMVPTHVALLKTEGALPCVDEWTTDQPVRPLCLKMLRDKLVLAVALQTSALDTTLVVFHAPYTKTTARLNELDMQSVSLTTKGVLLDWEMVKADDDDDDDVAIYDATQCQLLAVFSSTQQQPSETIFCMYPPAADFGILARQTSIMAQEPVVQPSEFFLYSSHLDESDASAPITFTDNTVAAAVHAVDKQNMQRLSRNCHLDQVPSRPVLVEALQELVPGYRVPEHSTMELETLLVIQELRMRQMQSKRFGTTPRRQTLSLSTSGNAGAMSIYDQLTPSALPDVEEMNVDDDGEDADQEADVERQVKEHQQRWNMLFAAIRKAQYLERLPCMLKICGDELFLLRSGTTSVVRRTNTWNLTDQLKDVDESAMYLIRALEAGPATQRALRKHEQLIWNFVASGRFAFENFGVEEMGGALEEMIKSSLASLTVKHGLPFEQQRVVQKFMQLPENDRVMALQNTSLLLRRNHLPGLNLLSAADMEVDTMCTDDVQVVAKQLRLSAIDLNTRCLESLRRLCLGRSLMLLSASNDEDQSVCLRMYVHMVGLLWASCQLVASPTLARTGALVVVGHSSPPRKRVGAISSAETTLVVDALIQQLPVTQLPSMSSTMVAIHLCKQVSATCLSTIRTADKLPELGIIAYQAKMYPHIAIRLVAPFVKYVTSFDTVSDTNARKEVLAECLLIESLRASKENAVAMVQRAQSLLPFDVQDFTASKWRLGLLCQNLVSNLALAEELLDYVDAAIATLNDFQADDGKHARDELMAQLLNARFDAAIVVHRWDDAVMACYEMHRRDRQQHIERLVRAMVESGDLSRLIEFCGSPSEISERAYLETYAAKTDFASIAVETLFHGGARDAYLLRATQEGPLTDYLGALFAIFISQSDWKRAAEVQNLIFEKARTALGNEPQNLDHRTRLVREELIIKDMVQSAIACRQAIDQIQCDDDKFIIPRAYGEVFATSALNANSPLRVRPRSSSPGSPQAQSKQSCLFARDIVLRAHLTVALSTVYFDGVEDDGVNNSVDFAKSTLGAGARSPAFVGDTVTELLDRGYIFEALVLVFAVNEVSLMSRHENLGNMLELLIKFHLIPLVHDKTYTPERPTLQQISRALDIFGDPNAPPIVLIGDRSKVASACGRSDIRTAAFELMRRITLRFSNSHNLLANRVSSIYITLFPTSPLPQWLEELMIFGTDRKEAIGMFAKYATKDDTGFPGDPSALLTWYTMHGMYEDACRVVIATLVGPDPMARRESAPARLAHRGKMDFVPVEKIDLLFSLMDNGMRKGIFDDKRLEAVRASRKSLEDAVIDHLQLLKISTEGLPSAMAMQY